MMTLKLGSVGPDVVALQRVLGVGADGIFGHATGDALRERQRRLGLAPDGIAGPRTLIALGLLHRDEQLPVVQTPISARDYARGVGGAWRKLTAERGEGALPTKEQLGVLWSQFMIETGGTHCYDFNLGNIKEIPGDGIPYMALHGVWEIIAGRRKELSPDDPGSWFSAFRTLEEGAEFYLRKLMTRFARSWTFVLQGDPVAFARALRMQHYYTGDPDAYAAGMKLHFAAWMKTTHFEEGIADLERSGVA